MTAWRLLCMLPARASCEAADNSARLLHTDNHAAHIITCKATTRWAFVSRSLTSPRLGLTKPVAVFRAHTAFRSQNLGPHLQLGDLSLQLVHACRGLAGGLASLSPQLGIDPLQLSQLLLHQVSGHFQPINMLDFPAHCWMFHQTYAAPPAAPAAGKGTLSIKSASYTFQPVAGCIL